MNRALPRLLLWLLIGVLALAACGTGESEDDPSPTPPGVAQNTNTPPPAVNTPTPLPTIGLGSRSTPSNVQAPTALPVPTRVAINPTALPATAIAITSPPAGSVLRGTVAVTGSASHPSFSQYALEYGPDPNPSNLWYPITAVPITNVVVNNVLGAWNTTTVADGNYQLRLHVWLRTGAEEFRVVPNLQVRNTQQAPRPPNNNPIIAPIQRCRPGALAIP
ncbi:MAG: hypothetical protein HC915_16615 [Anaerolineae bacterium]|nr:hypothetical protein [Anaerolineae bacterium]